MSLDQNDPRAAREETAVNRLLHAPGLGPGAQAALRPALCRDPVQHPGIHTPAGGEEREGRRESPPLKVPPSRLRAGQGTRPLPTAASALGRAWQRPLPSCLPRHLHRELPRQVPGTKPKEAFEPLVGQAAAFIPRQELGRGLQARSWEAPTAPSPAVPGDVPQCPSCRR